MDATLTDEKNLKIAMALGKLLEDHKGGEVVVMDMRNLNFWTDFFIIATVTSSTHLSGLDRHIKEFANENGVDILRHSRKQENKSINPGGIYSAGMNSEQPYDEWRLIDLGEIVIHLMTAKTRSFFELERLWSAAPLLFKSGGQSHSSKSS